MSVARPAVNLLKGPLRNDIKKHVIIALGLSAVVAYGYKHFVSDWRKTQYQNFYKTYDEERHFNRMVQAGVFQSVKPDTEAPQWVKDYEKEVDEAIAALKK